MVSINYSAREVCCKIVYYGPGLSGKTTNLQYVHAKVPGDTRGKLISLATEADRTLYFDFLPINIGSINGFAAKFQLYTVPGQVYYNATRKLVLRGVDGLVFVADSQPDKMDENIESLLNLEENLQEYGYTIDEMPIVIQYNKRDLPGVLPVADLNSRLNTRDWPWYEASATIGNGVFDTLKLIIKLVLDKAKKGGSAAPKEGRSPAAAPSASGQIRTVAPEPSSAQPAAAQPSPQPIAVAQTSTPAPAPPPAVVSAPSAPSPEAPMEARPFPGDQTGGVPARRITPSSNAPSPRKSEGLQIRSSEEAAADQAPTVPRDLSTPGMAPALRRRSTKKRGFFKRLFGIK